MATLWIDADSVLLNLGKRLCNFLNTYDTENMLNKFGRKVDIIDFQKFTDVLELSNLTKELFESPNLYHNDISDSIKEILIEPEPGSKILMDIVIKENINFKILTHSFNEKVAKSKEIALKGLFDIEPEKVVHTKDKWKFLQEGDAFIDDANHNILDALANCKNIQLFMPIQPWNKQIEGCTRSSLIHISLLVSNLNESFKKEN